KFNEESLSDAKRIAKKLKIKHFIYDYKELFHEKVIEPFINEYINGYTPNPCLKCNQNIKFGLFYDLLEIHNADFIATGHYIKKIYDKKTKIYSIMKPKNLIKDQTYLMYFLNQWQLEHTLFPLGDIENKSEVKEIVKDFDFKISDKRESVNICFTDENDYRLFINENNKVDVSGNFVDINGKILGRHNGIYNFTIGQKRNLGLKTNEKYTVIEIIGDSNEIVLGDDKLAYHKILIAKEINIINPDLNIEDIELTAKICQWGYFLKCKVKKIDNNRMKVVFHEEVRAITLGQAIVFYYDSNVIGGGIIEKIVEY
ncbi:tRNA 2-thiouridine(34) synthase MnmA, partial [Clostridiaceae bacterium HSG29]|nr:tRNA 2-thiouridine(34) synthase MnmA [Clostridiaceae bacterium HSG29]